MDVLELEFDERNTEEIARHGVTAREVEQVLYGEPKFFRNKKRHAAPTIMVGLTRGGRLLTVPIAPTAIEGIWRPATAFDSSAYEATKYYS